MDYLQYTKDSYTERYSFDMVLNLIINGLPSILTTLSPQSTLPLNCFKPYYKWITFNTKLPDSIINSVQYLSFKPYYKWITFNTQKMFEDYSILYFLVLNLIINGLPSILPFSNGYVGLFKTNSVLNLIINGLPSILSIKLESCKSAEEMF